jgi:hypothetical protein
VEPLAGGLCVQNFRSIGRVALVENSLNSTANCAAATALRCMRLCRRLELELRFRLIPVSIGFSLLRVVAVEAEVAFMIGYNGYNSCNNFF